MAFVTATAGVQVLIKSLPDTFWTKIQDSANSFPEAAPNLYSSIAVSGTGVRKVEYGPDSQNIKNSSELITENSRGKLAYTVTDGDILQKYKVKTFQAEIIYPNTGKWVEWIWTYNYLPEDKTRILELDEEIAVITVKTLAKLDSYIQNKLT
ncbi:hypothetical protein P3X46_003393 [Hevea brasiliensis]|uniref:Bet v I/Major latex protein domain-containing protein n=1 Tax=Hevea brasiliensis TaxID=3981 RepID=A0ABQ9NAX9_HEVBR|nr:uncharacterized protein LOC131168728 [Hevea brasiliensis]KAJ9187989.1 hypothetical protein P3X46_003393 [Hevea brasiliensis]